VTLPGPPANLTATAGIGQATVMWNPPSSNGGSPITSYTVMTTSGGFNTSTSASSTTITGLTAGSSYTFLVYATTAVGNGSTATSNTITLPTVPNVPGSPSATLVSGAIDVAWMAPPNGGSPITGYTLTLVQTGATMMTTATTATWSGLGPGTYTFTVIATNIVGSSAPSPASPAVNIAMPPTNLTYSSNPAVYQIGQTITNNVPSNGGGVAASYTISGVLPAGLNFNDTTGIISGDPNSPLNAANFTVTASNTGGSTSTTITITVNCSDGAEPCDNACPNYYNDNNNCGRCGNACGGWTCCAGSCCGNTCCGGNYCTDTWTDPYNCGSCGVDCELDILEKSCCSGSCCL
jgi:hypothetical protein